MASLEIRGETYYLHFRFGGKHFKRSLQTSDETEANGWKSNVEETLRDIKRGKLAPPPESADIPTYITSGGKMEQQVRLKPAEQTLTLDGLFKAYFESLPEGSREENTLYTMGVHQRHLCLHLGEGFDIQRISLSDLQSYVSKRSKKTGKNKRKVGASTIKKEIVSLRTVWNWAVRQKKLTGRFPSAREIEFPKEQERPPFQTRAEIEKQIGRGGLKERQITELWQCLYLTSEEVESFLDYLKESNAPAWLYPAMVMAAHTGARRSEIFRAEVGDFDGDQVTIRERKRVRGKLTTRRVPISNRLREAIDTWMTVHPGGNMLFAMAGIVRSRSKRTRPEPITRNMAYDHLRRALKDSEWRVIKGFHVARHSFISACAVRGVDQRMVEEWAGHSSSEISRLYRHLAPSAQRDAFSMVFG